LKHSNAIEEESVSDIIQLYESNVGTLLVRQKSSKSESCYRMTFKAMMEDLGGKFDPATIGKSAASFGVPSFVLY